MPVTMALFLISGLSLVGIPLTAGFISKWYIILGAIESGYFIAVPVILISSLLSLIYIWRVIEIAYFGNKDTVEKILEQPLSLIAPALITSLLCVFFGFYTQLPLQLSKKATEILLGY
jgi:multicomponent Na+:H+ antiporter subunit D